MTQHDDKCPCHTPQPVYSQIGQKKADNPISEILALAARPEVISFGGGLPSPAGFPAKELQEAANAVLAHDAARALQYSSGQGLPELREQIARFETQRGVPTKPENVLIVSGSQQALDLIGRCFIDPGSRILVECPTYLGALDAFKMSKPVIEPLPTDEKGLNPELMDASCKGARFAYVMPTFQNPTGLTLAEDRREKLAEKAREYDLWLVEDNPYGELYYADAPSPSMRKYAPERTITLGTMSKILAPGLRLGYIVAPVDVIDALVSVKISMDLHTSTFSQLIVAHVMQSGLLAEHLPKVRQIYANKAKVMLEALDKYMPKHPELSWTRPTGGMFIWLNLPKNIDATDLVKKVLASDVPVGFVPGVHFYGCEPEVNHARFSFVTVPEEKIIKGVESVAKALTQMLQAQ